MTLQADLYFSFRSPYSYLAIGRYRALTEIFDVAINLRPVYPLAIRQPEFFAEGNRAAGRYIFMDAARVAQQLDIPYRWPRPDPVVQEIATMTIPAEQPYIYRIVRMGQAAARRGNGLKFADEVSKLIWDGKTDNWHEGDHLAGAAERAGLDFAELEAEVTSDAERLDAEIAANQEALEAAGHWGVPTLVFDGEPFFGQDRIEMVLWRMNEKGLAER
ncbi:2-hydroxychromene-2-carboxylate isomerase [Pontixanthobacter aquaemixtae]|uniref:2-hydroxychromene-2-carboxylate isomerase n=1 Tax=Pontixanthobacter aquaemixtae TaxID=1958940 RepID=A0A844ZRM4_9SPHN|nr:2-hydroxychromene-2-carboxylate isomerase [Pontixanthobacter aquaemixtae]MXO90505.1 2-hydroxychromene-2-carboxylate isomerase [Pontixanthobacter aquaemixtae]